MLSRRGLLQLGVVGSAAIWAGGLVGCAARRVSAPISGAPRAALSPPGEEIMRAVIPVVVGPLFPTAEPARAQALDTGIAKLDDYLAYLSTPLQDEAGNAFETLDLWPVRLALLRTTNPWRDISPRTIESFLRSGRDSRFDLLRRMTIFLQSMAVLAWFDQPAAWESIGYPGPPIERPAISAGQA